MTRKRRRRFPRHLEPVTGTNVGIIIPVIKTKIVPRIGSREDTITATSTAAIRDIVRVVNAAHILVHHHDLVRQSVLNADEEIEMMMITIEAIAGVIVHHLPVQHPYLEILVAQSTD